MSAKTEMKPEIRELTNDETEAVGGGVLPAVGGFLVLSALIGFFVTEAIKIANRR